MKKPAPLALLALTAFFLSPSLDAAPSVPPIDGTAQATEEATESEEGEESENGYTAPAKIDIDAFDRVETTSRHDEEEALLPEGESAALLEEAELADEPSQGAADLLRQAIRIRELKTLVSRDTAVRAEKERARRTRTPEGWRTAMRNYYTVLYKKMISLDADLKEPLEAELQVKLVALEQHRIRPSALIEAVPVLPGSRSADYAGEVVIEERRGIEPLVDESDPRR